jgi:septal ring factor EnvC (AmiA/AmiB activator)
MRDTAMPSTDAKWIIGVVLVLGSILIAQNAGIRNELHRMDADITDIRTDIRRLDDRLRAVEVTLGKVEQRLATLERIILPGDQPD